MGFYLEETTSKRVRKWVKILELVFIRERYDRSENFHYIIYFPPFLSVEQAFQYFISLFLSLSSLFRSSLFQTVGP